MPRMPKPPAPRVPHECSSSLANVLLCDVLNSLAERSPRRGFMGGDPVVVLKGQRLALVGSLVSGGLFAIDTKAKLYSCDALTLFPTRTNPDRAIYTSDDVAWTIAAEQRKRRGAA